MSATAPKLSKITRVDVATETAFATTAGADTHVRTLEVDRGSLTWTSLEDLHARTGLYETSRILGPRNGMITLRMNLAGSSGSLPVGAPADTTHWLATIAAWAFGSIQSGGYSANTDTTTSLVSAIKAADLTTFKTGSAMAFATQSKGYQVAWVQDNTAGATDTITPLQTVGGVPYEGGDIISVDLYGSTVVAMASGWDYYSAGVRESLRLTLYGHESDDKVICYGCGVGNFKVSLTAGQIPVVEVPIMVAYWDEIGSGGAPAIGSWTAPDPEALLSSWIQYGAGGTSPFRCHNLEFDLGMTLAPIPDSNKAGGIGGWAVQDRKPRVSFSVYRSLAAEVADWEAQTARSFTATFGSQPGKMFSLCVPAGRIIDWPGPTDDGGFVSSKVVLAPNYYSGDTVDAGSALDNTICRLAFL